jgi:hypothetical protein
MSVRAAIQVHPSRRPYAQHVSYMFQMPTMQAWQKLNDEGKLNEVEAKGNGFHTDGRPKILFEGHVFSWVGLFLPEFCFMFWPTPACG